MEPAKGGDFAVPADAFLSSPSSTSMSPFRQESMIASPVLMSVSTPQAGAFRGRTGRGIGGVLAALGLAALVGCGVALAFSAAARPSTSLAAAAGVAGLAALCLALARYEAAAALGMLMLGVVFVKPAPPDALLMTVIAVAIATGRFTLRRVPAPVLLLLAAFLLLNLISTVFANEPHRAATYLLITTYLCLLGIWVSGFVDSPSRARVIIAPLIAGAVITAAIGVAVLFVHFPGSSTLDFSDGFRARGFFKDPNVFGPFCAFAALFVVSELLEPRLLRANRPLKLFCLVVLVLGTLFAYSRAAWLNAAVSDHDHDCRVRPATGWGSQGRGDARDARRPRRCRLRGTGRDRVGQLPRLTRAPPEIRHDSILGAGGGVEAGAALSPRDRAGPVRAPRRDRVLTTPTCVCWPSRGRWGCS